MCRFHREAAASIAHNPATGEPDPVRYAVTLLALSQFRIEQYAPQLAHVSGYDPAAMNTPDARFAYAQSGLSFDGYAAERQRAAFLPMLQVQLGVTLFPRHAGSTGTDAAALGIPECPAARERWQNAANASLWQGDPRGPLTLAAHSDDPALEPLRAATERFLARPGVAATLQRVFEATLTTIFVEAQTGKPSAAARPGPRCHGPS